MARPIKCFAGCERDAILKASGVCLADLGSPQATNSATAQPQPRRVVLSTSLFEIRDVGGELRAVHQRRDFSDGTKQFSWRRPDGRLGLNGTRATSLPLYRSETLAEVSGIFIVVEGERAADVLARELVGDEVGVVATVTGAATCPSDAVLSVLSGRRVVLWPDNDQPGNAHMAKMAQALGRVGALDVRVVDWPDAPPHGDAVEFCASHGRDELLGLLDAAMAFGHSESTTTVPPRLVEPPALSLTPRILDAFAVAITGCGVVGELVIAKLVYLVLTSRVLPKPVSLGVKGLSSSGKSFVVETTLRFFPARAYLAGTAMSPRALIYTEEDLRHRTLVLFEVDAMREGNDEDPTAYIIRSLLSEGRIDYEVTVRSKDKGYSTRHILKEGPTGLIFTTTRDQLHGENETRVLSVTLDDSKEQTQRILAALAAGGGETIDLQPWLDLQSWLQTAEHRAVIPYAAALATVIPPVAVRLRRDFTALLSLISAHAILHQQTRERDGIGRIVATWDDYEQVRPLVAPLISEGVGCTVSAATREAVDAVKALAPLHPEGVTATVLAKRLNLDKSAARRRLMVAARGGWVTNAEDRRGKPGRWQPGEALSPEDDILPTVERLQVVAKALATTRRPDFISGSLSGGTVAVSSERSNDVADVVLL